MSGIEDTINSGICEHSKESVECVICLNQECEDYRDEVEKLKACMAKIRQLGNKGNCSHNIVVEHHKLIDECLK